MKDLLKIITKDTGNNYCILDWVFRCRNSMKGVIGGIMAQLIGQLRLNNPKGAVRDTGKTYI